MLLKVYVRSREHVENDKDRSLGGHTFVFIAPFPHCLSCHPSLFDKSIELRPSARPWKISTLSITRSTTRYFSDLKQLAMAAKVLLWFAAAVGAVSIPALEARTLHCPPFPGTFSVDAFSLYPENLDFDSIHCKLYLGYVASFSFLAHR